MVQCNTTLLQSNCISKQSVTATQHGSVQHHITAVTLYIKTVCYSYTAWFSATPHYCSQTVYQNSLLQLHSMVQCNTTLLQSHCISKQSVIATQHGSVQHHTTAVKLYIKTVCYSYTAWFSATPHYCNHTVYQNSLL